MTAGERKWGLVATVAASILAVTFALRSLDGLPTEFDAAQVAKYASAWGRESEKAATASVPSAASSGFEAVVLPSRADVVFACEIPMSSTAQSPGDGWTAQLGSTTSWGRYVAPDVAEPTLDVITYPSDSPVHIVILVEPGTAAQEVPSLAIRPEAPLPPGTPFGRAMSPALVVRVPGEALVQPPRSSRALRQEVSLSREGTYGSGFLVPTAGTAPRSPRVWILDSPPGPPPPPPLRAVRIGPVFADPGTGTTLVKGPLEMRAADSKSESELGRAEPEFWNAMRGRFGDRLPYLPIVKRREALVGWFSRRIFDRYATIHGRRVYIGSAFVTGRGFASIQRPKSPGAYGTQDGVPDAVRDMQTVFLSR